MVEAKRPKELAEDLRGVFAAPNREVALGLASPELRVLRP
jgi:hypothetical protein